jgi:2-keto-3-deoxy-L-rhamnonate aldolase RhmA
MRPNPVKEALRGGAPVFGIAAVTGWGGMPRAAHEAGFDFLLMDDEHRTLGIETNQVLVAGARALGLTASSATACAPS